MGVKAQRLVRVEKFGHLVEVVTDFREAGGEEMSEETSRTRPVRTGGRRRVTVIRV